MDNLKKYIYFPKTNVFVLSSVTSWVKCTEDSSPCGLITDEMVKVTKISSVGSGFTLPLQPQVQLLSNGLKVAIC